MRSWSSDRSGSGSRTNPERESTGAPSLDACQDRRLSEGAAPTMASLAVNDLTAMAPFARPCRPLMSAAAPAEPRRRVMIEAEKPRLEPVTK